MYVIYLVILYLEHLLPYSQVYLPRVQPQYVTFFVIFVLGLIWNAVNNVVDRFSVKAVVNV